MEVKATGAAGFQLLSTKDVTADVLAWVDFGTHFTNGLPKQAIVYWLRNPGHYGLTPGKITLGRFLEVADSNIVRTVLTP